MDYMHLPVLPLETISALDIKKDGTYLDCTLGGCGHTKLILDSLGENGSVIGLDRDENAIKNAAETVKDKRLTAVHSHYEFASQVLMQLGIDKVDGVLFDLGVSSHQLDTAERGFSYRFDAPLDMRMDVRDSLSAYEVVNGYTEQQLERILREYGEEKFSRKIARAICDNRAEKAIENTLQLVDIISSAVPAKYRFEGGSPAKRSFQAIRIEVNGELEALERSLRSAFECIKPGGRMVVLTFHSLEDRIVKNVFSSLEDPCTCPKNLPCVCGKKPLAKPAIRKSVTASEEELKANKRSHSARLRAIEKL